jgi:phage baseplate assembly protein W
MAAGKLFRLGISNNLEVGGTYDMLLMDFSGGFPVGAVDFTLTNTPRKITGIQKVAQTFLLTLMTTRGSDALRPNKGTRFSALAMYANRVGTAANVEAELIDEITDAEAQVKYILNRSTDDLTSQLDRVQVLAIDVGEESITMFLYIITRAGERAQVAIPFPQLDMRLAE